MISKVLIANRGEIAVRIARTLREMGIVSVAVYSDPDAGTPHVRACDEAYHLPGESSAATYLQADRLIEIATACGADAVHPGFGFLSENAAFAEACAAAGITFIGPSPDAIRAMGDKVVAKRMMEEAGVPVLGGWTAPAEATADDARTEAESIGYPVLVKAAAGGGGKGMRVVHDPSEMDEAFESAKREAKAAFGDDRVFLERYVERARHIEFQIFGDTHGAVTHLGERECSIQRRHQKIIEEAPSPGVTDEIRSAMGDAAVKAAAALGYTGAGTVEFMLEESGAFFFLEVNTRLQVEHPVTELTRGVDLVRAQVLVAAGEPMPFDEASRVPHGHAFECRIYAEDAARDFMPSTGVIHGYDAPAGPNIRVDSGVTQGTEVSVHYDPMLSKLIVWGSTRDEALERMRTALREYVVLGVTTNLVFLERVMDHAAFRSGDLHTRFLEEHAIDAAECEIQDVQLIAAALGAMERTTTSGVAESSSWPGPWTSHAWRVG